jgi:hypothetical protein
LTDLNNAQICSKMPHIELRAGRELSDIVSSIDNIGNFCNVISNVGGNRSSQRETKEFLDELFMFSAPLDCIQDCWKNYD